MVPRPRPGALAKVGQDMSSVALENWTLDFVAKLDEAPDEGAASTLFNDFVGGFGFSRAIVMRIPEVGDTPEKCVALNTFPHEWTDHYYRSGYHHRDPVMRRITTGVLPYTWGEAFKSVKAGKTERAIFNEAREFHLRDGLVVPIVEAGGSTGLVSVAGDDVDLSDVPRRALNLASVYFHSTLSRLRRRALEQDMSLTPREFECLKWVAEGKSDWEIGQILSISAKTVNYHIENAKRKFGVATRVQAVVAALRAGRLYH